MAVALGTSTPDLDDGGGHEHVELAALERAHHRVLLVGGQLAVQQTRAAGPASSPSSSFGITSSTASGGRRLVRTPPRLPAGRPRASSSSFGSPHPRAHHVHLVPGRDLLAHAPPHAREPGRALRQRHDGGGDRRPPGGQLAQRGHLQVAVDGHRHRARDRRRRHHQHVRHHVRAAGPRRASRCSTPKRCCSSTTTRPSSANSTRSWISAWVPTTMPASPDSASSSAFVFACRRQRTREQRDPGGDVRPRPAHRPGRAARAATAASGRAARRAPRWARAWRPASVSTTCSIARSATTVLPAPTSPCTSRFIGAPGRQIRRDLVADRPLPGGQGVAAAGRRTPPAGHPTRAGSPPPAVDGLPGGAARARAARPGPRPTPAGSSRCTGPLRLSGRWMRRSARPSSDRPSAPRSDAGSGSCGLASSSSTWRTQRPIARSRSPGGRRVDRQERADALALLDRLELRVGELQLVPEPGDLAGEQRPQPRGPSPSAACRVEEGAVQPPPAPVGDDDLHQLAAPVAHVAQRDLLDLARAP